MNLAYLIYMDQTVNNSDTKWSRIDRMIGCIEKARMKAYQEVPKFWAQTMKLSSTPNTIVTHKCVDSSLCESGCGQRAELVLGVAYYGKDGRRQCIPWEKVCTLCAVEFRKEITRIQTEKSAALCDVVGIVHRKYALSLWVTRAAQLDIKAGHITRTCCWCARYSRCRCYGPIYVCVVCSPRIDLLVSLTTNNLERQGKKIHDVSVNEFIESADEFADALY